MDGNRAVLEYRKAAEQGTLGAAGVTGFNIYSMVVAVIGAIIVLVLYHALVRKRS